MSKRKIVSPTDKELWENSCLTREQLRTWTDSDLAKHIVGVRKTLNYLFDLVDSVESSDPREPDHSRQGIFVHHNCWRCHNGELPCVNGKPTACEYPYARND